MSSSLPTKTCETCKGAGKHEFFNKKWMRKTWQTCKECEGKGFHWDLEGGIRWARHRAKIQNQNEH